MSQDSSLYHTRGTKVLGTMSHDSSPQHKNSSRAEASMSPEPLPYRTSNSRAVGTITRDPSPQRRNSSKVEGSMSRDHSPHSTSSSRAGITSRDPSPHRRSNSRAMGSISRDPSPHHTSRSRAGTISRDPSPHSRNNSRALGSMSRDPSPHRTSSSRAGTISRDPSPHRRNSSRAVGSIRRDTSPHRTSSSRTGTISRDHSPHRTNNSRAVGSMSRDPSPHRTSSSRAGIISHDPSTYRKNSSKAVSSISRDPSPHRTSSSRVGTMSRDPSPHRINSSKAVGSISRDPSPHRNSSSRVGTMSRDPSPHRINSSKTVGSMSRDPSPHRSSSSRTTGTKSRDSSPHRLGSQGRITTTTEPEWINRDRILRPVGANDKKEEGLVKTNEVAWKNRETFLKSTPLHTEVSPDHKSFTYDGWIKENQQTSPLRAPQELPSGHNLGSQHKYLERSHVIQKSEQQYKPRSSYNPEFFSSKHTQEIQRHSSLDSLTENETQCTQNSFKQEAKIHGEWSQYKPAGPLSCHTPESQVQQYFGNYHSSGSSLSYILLRSTAAQTDRGVSEKVESRPPSPQESVCTMSQIVPDIKHSLHELNSRAQSPTEALEFKTPRLHTPPPNTTKTPNRPRTPSPEPTQSILKVTSSSCYENTSLQHKEDNPQAGGKTAQNYNETPAERTPQQTQDQPSFASPELDLQDTQTYSSTEAKHLIGSSMYKPAGPLSCYRPDPQPQHIVEWYSGTESPLSKVVLRPTRTHMSANIIVSQAEAQKENANKESYDANTESKSQNVTDGKKPPPESVRGAYISPDSPKKESQEIQTSQSNAISKGSQVVTPSSEPIPYHMTDIQMSNSPEIARKEFFEPWLKTSDIDSVAEYSKYGNFQTDNLVDFYQDGHCSFDSTPEMIEAWDYLNTTVKYVKPDLLNFKKGWMSLLDGNGEWKKHWFVLTDSSLKYYRDSNAEEADELDGEIDLRTCTDVPEFSVQRNYGFQIHTNEGVFTLSAMTSGIRRNWIEALRKNVHPVSIPDVTKLSESNKENTFVPSRTTPRPDELRLVSEVRQRKIETIGSRQSSFDYVELSPLSPAEERDQRLEERKRWFEATPGGDTPSTPRTLTMPLTEEQKQRINEDIESKWKELERLPLRETKQTLTCLLAGNKNKTTGENTSALEKQIQSLKMQLEKAKKEIESHKGGYEGTAPPGFISQEACEYSVSQMENSHKQLLSELQRHHEWEIQRLRQEKDQLLAEEAAATASVIEAIRAAHKEELQREVEKARTFQHGGSTGNEMLRRQHQSDMDALRRELQTLSERYSQKCLEIGALNQASADRERELQRCQQEAQELLRHNQELNSRLSEEIAKLRTFMSGNGPNDGRLQAGEKNSAELEVLLRVKENELQYLRKEVSCLREDLQNMQKDKKYASQKYKDIYVELNNIKSRSEREIDQLKEHLRLAMAALREEAALRNSVGE